MATEAAEAVWKRPETLASRTVFGLLHVGPAAQTGRTRGKKKATDEFVTALLAPREVAGEVGVIWYHCALAYALALALRLALTVPVVLAVKIEP